MRLALTGARACEPGEGVGRDTAFAAELLQHAADAGDPGAQGEVGWRAALGLRPSADHLFTFGRPDVPRCPTLHAKRPGRISGKGVVRRLDSMVPSVAAVLMQRSLSDARVCERAA